MKKKEEEIEYFYPANKEQWREWLQKNHDQKQAVWLICYRKNAGIPTVSWSEAVDEALCFGWIDSKKKPIDEEKSMQFFSRRKAKSTWSKINKEKIQQLIDDGRMTQSGLASVDLAKQNGSWTILDEVEALIIPNDLETALMIKPAAKTFFMSLSKSVQKSMLQWLVLSKRPETRQKRINEIATFAQQQMKPTQFR